MINCLLALFLIITQVSAAHAQAQRHRSKKQPLTAEQIAASILPSVVLIKVDCDGGLGISQGSGFFVSQNLIATNRHVVECGAKGVIKLNDQRPQYPITSIYVADDSAHDLALIKVDGAATKSLPLGKSQNITIGKTVYVAGNPRGLEGTFSSGIISSIRKDVGWVQFTAPISPGSSGGPVVNDSGEVIGVTTASITAGQNLNFAVEVSHLNDLINRVQRGLISPKSVVNRPVVSSGGKPYQPPAPTAPPNRRRKYEGGLRLTLLIDRSESVNPVFNQIVEAGRRLINNLKDDDEASVVAFAGAGLTLQDFTSDKKKLITSLDNLKVEGNGKDLTGALREVCTRAADYADSKGGRPAIVTITGGVKGYASGSSYFFTAFPEVPVFTIGLVKWLGNRAAFSQQSERDATIKLLTDIAQKSGGRAFLANSLVELPENIREIANSLHQPNEVDAELKFWKETQLSGKPEAFEAYLTKYPNGTFADSARSQTTEGKTLYQELFKIVAQIVAANRSGDRSVFQRLLADNYISIGEGKVYTKQQILAEAKPDSHVKSFHFEMSELSFIDGKPILTYSIKYEGLVPILPADVLGAGFNEKRTARFLNSLSFMNQQGQWKAVELRWSRISN